MGHIDIAEVQTAECKLALFEAINRTSKFAFVQLVESANRITASTFLVALIAAVPYEIHSTVVFTQFSPRAEGAQRPTICSVRKVRRRSERPALADLDPFPFLADFLRS